MNTVLFLFISALSAALSCQITITGDNGFQCTNDEGVKAKVLDLEKQLTILKNQYNRDSAKELFGRKNLALKKKCEQKSILDDLTTAEKAVDGNLDTLSCTKPTYDKDGVHYGTSSPYWWVDLGKNFKVKRVDIYNRMDCCGERLRDLEVTIGKTLNSMKLCAFYKGPAGNGELVILTCKEPTEGRYVKLMIMDENRKENFLQLAEVEVYE